MLLNKYMCVPHYICMSHCSSNIVYMNYKFIYHAMTIYMPAINKTLICQTYTILPITSYEQQHKGSTNCCTIWYLCQFFLIILAFIDNFYGYDVTDDLIQGEIVQNCTASFWSVFIYPGEIHDWLLFFLILIGQSRSHDLIKLLLQFQLNCLHQVVLVN